MVSVSNPTLAFPSDKPFPLLSCLARLFYHSNRKANQGRSGSQRVGAASKGVTVLSHGRTDFDFGLEKLLHS